MMAVSETSIHEGREPTQHELERVSNPHKSMAAAGLYKKMVRTFDESKKPVWTYPVPKGVDGSTYLSGFKRARDTLGLRGKVSVHGCRSDEGDAIVLKHEE